MPTIAHSELIDSLYREHSSHVLAHVRRFGPDVAEEAAAAAWLIACLHGETLAEHEAPLGWLLTVAYHEACQLARRRGRVELIGEVDVLPAPDILDRVEVREVLRELAAMRPGRRAAIAGAAVGVTHREVSAARGSECASGANTWLNRHVHEGRRELRERLGRD